MRRTLMRRFNKDNYYEWLKDFICPADMEFVPNSKGHRAKEYDKFIQYLFDTEFVWTIENDVNRANDGLELRWEYADDTNEDPMDINTKPCSVLEMLVALCLRIERQIMGEPGDDHPEKWFWIIIDNLGLIFETNRDFDRPFIDRKIRIWLNREYEKNGFEGIFPLNRPIHDQRKVEIWVQANEYLNENYSFV